MPENEHNPGYRAAAAWDNLIETLRNELSEDAKPAIATAIADLHMAAHDMQIAYPDVDVQNDIYAAGIGSALEQASGFAPVGCVCTENVTN